MQEELVNDRSDSLLQEAENSKIGILDPPGKNGLGFYDLSQGRVMQQNQNQIVQHHPAIVDKDFLVVGNYIEKYIKQKIKNGEYIDFAHLLPRDRMEMEEEGRMEIVNRNGRTYFIPAQDSGGTMGQFQTSPGGNRHFAFSPIFIVPNFLIGLRS